MILQNNEGMEENADLILRLEATGYLPKFDYATGQAVVVPRQGKLIAHCELWKAMLRAMEAPNAGTD